MKKMKKLLLVLLCAAMVQTLLVPLTITRAAAKKDGLVTVKNTDDYGFETVKYYFYENGVKVKNTWKLVPVTENGKTVKYKYYFGKTGVAYAANPTNPDTKYEIAYKKINGKYYGFDRYGHMVKNGIYVDKSGRFFAFDKKGVYDSAKSGKLRKAAKAKVNAAPLIKLLGKYQKRVQMGNSCFIDGAIDYVLYYGHFEVDVCRKDGVDYFIGAFAL